MIVTDLSMPDLDGVELIRRIRSVRPHLRVLVCTGFSTAEYEARLKELKVQRTLLEPVPMNDLVAAIREVLDT